MEARIIISEELSFLTKFLESYCSFLLVVIYFVDCHGYVISLIIISHSLSLSLSTIKNSLQRTMAD